MQSYDCTCCFMWEFSHTEEGKNNQAFQSKRLKRESGAIRDEVEGGWNTRCKGDLHDVCFEPEFTGISITDGEMDRAYGTHGKEEKDMQVCGGNSQRKDVPVRNIKA